MKPEIVRYIAEKGSFVGRSKKRKIKRREGAVYWYRSQVLSRQAPTELERLVVETYMYLSPCPIYVIPPRRI